ncbi:MAG: hypothetical protein KJ069_13970 [Anaerolineae bacterium]|nr:hypothetical protein [Anaerolineae bacterium]
MNSLTAYCLLLTVYDFLQNTMWQPLCSRENLIAIALCLLVILLIIVTTDSAPQWIYQGF